MKTKLAAMALFAFSPALFSPRAWAQTSVPPGTELTVELQTGISTKTTRSGDPFTGRVTSPAEYEGSTIHGHVGEITESGRLQGKTVMTLDFDDIQLPGGRVEPIRAELTELRQSEKVKVVDEEGRITSGSRGDQAIKRTAIGAAVGGALGGLIGGGKGALLGILLGGGAGAGSLAIEGNKELRLESGTQMEIRTLSPSRGREMARSEYTTDSGVIREVQEALNGRGYDVGTPDGQLGSRTRAALRRFQADNGLVSSGRVDRDTAEKLGVRW